MLRSLQAIFLTGYAFNKLRSLQAIFFTVYAFNKLRFLQAIPSTSYALHTLRTIKIRCVVQIKMFRRVNASKS
jgi:hypothetical protein